MSIILIDKLYKLLQVLIQSTSTPTLYIPCRLIMINASRHFNYSPIFHLVFVIIIYYVKYIEITTF